MAQMGVTAAATHFFTDHAVAEVAHAVGGGGDDGFGKGRPAALAVEFGQMAEQQGVAADAVVVAAVVEIVVLTAVGAFSGGLAGDLIHVRRQLGTPFGIGFADFVHEFWPGFATGRNGWDCSRC